MNDSNSGLPADSTHGQPIMSHTSPDTEEKAKPQGNAGIKQASLLPRWAHSLHEDANGTHLVNFPFSLAVFLILTAGLIAAGAGIIVASPWLALVGVLTTLIWAFLRGWSVCN